MINKDFKAVLDTIHFIDNDGKNIYRSKEKLEPQTIKDLEFCGYEVRKASTVERLTKGHEFIISWDDVKQMRIDRVSVRVDVIETISSMDEWQSIVNGPVSEDLKAVESKVFIDANGCVLRTSEDVAASAAMGAWPVRVHVLKSATEFKSILDKLEIKK